MWFSWNDRETPNPRALGFADRAVQRRRLAVLVLGATHGRFGVTTAVVAGTVIAAGTVVSLTLRRRQT